MSPLLKFLASIGIKSAESIGENLLEETLQKWNDADPEEFKKDIPVLQSILTRIKDFTDKTESKWDDPFVDVLYDSVNAALSKNQLKNTLSDTDQNGDGEPNETDSALTDPNEQHGHDNP